MGYYELQTHLTLRLTHPGMASTSIMADLAIKTNALFPYHFSEQFLPPTIDQFEL